MMLTSAVKNLLFINLSLFLVPTLLGKHDYFVDALGLHFINSAYFQPTQLITYMFMHADLLHIGMNMLGLAFMGSWLEHIWGATRFLIFYFMCGIGAGLLYMAVNYWQLHAMLEASNAFALAPTADGLANFFGNFQRSYYRDYLTFIENFAASPNDASLQQMAVSTVKKLTTRAVDVPMVGASGAIFGVLFGFGITLPNMEVRLLFPPITIKAKYLAMFLGLTEIYATFTNASGDNVAHWAHLGGMLFAFILIKVYKKF
jgi:membrane associated rhomboid family serine protease